MNRKLIVFGVGGGGLRFVKQLSQNDQLICFLDNDKNKQGKTLLKKPIYEPRKVKKLDYDMILIASVSYYKTMHEQLIGLGVEAKKIEAISGDILHLTSSKKNSSFCLCYYSLLTITISSIIYLLFF